MKIKSLVTGGAGFIGSHVTKKLILLGHEVVVLDDLSGGFQENLDPKSELVIGSITDVDLVNHLFEKYNFDYVYHLAAYAAEGLSHFIRRFNYENNLLGSVNLINASVNYKVKCFVFTSSIAVYGKGKLPFKESHTPEPEDPYGVAKQAVELDLMAANKMFGLNYIIFRPHNVYGPGQNIGDKYRNVVGIFMNQILKKEALTIFGNGEQTRAFSYIDDVAPYIAQSVEYKRAYNNVFNIGGDEFHSISDLALKVSESMGVETKTINLEERNEVSQAYSNHEKFNKLFEPKKVVKLELGLSIMAKWIKKNGAKTSNVFNQIEIKMNLPKSWE